MTKRLVIPKEHLKALVRILRFSQDERNRLIETIREAAPSIYGSKFRDAWMKKANVSEDESIGVFSLLASLYVSMDIARKSAQDFTEDVCNAIKASEQLDIKVTDIDWGEFKTYLVELLTLDDTLGVSAKAGDLRSEYGNIFCTARIMTDLRPIFGTDVEKSPKAAVIVHVAKIVFHESNREELREFYLALDAADIHQLKEILDRAIHKEESLKVAAKGGGINVLEI